MYTLKFYDNLEAVNLAEPSCTMKGVKKVSESMIGGWMFLLSDGRELVLPKSVLFTVSADNA